MNDPLIRFMDWCDRQGDYGILYFMGGFLLVLEITVALGWGLSVVLS